MEKILVLSRVVNLISITVAQRKDRHICEFLPQQNVKLTPVFFLALQGLAWQEAMPRVPAAKAKLEAQE